MSVAIKLEIFEGDELAKRLSSKTWDNRSDKTFKTKLSNNTDYSNNK